MTEFVPFPKLARLTRNIVITEKLDGTNACVHITADGEVLAGSRTRWITPEDDNYGFAKWVRSNRDCLLLLGEGTHFGEWWGNGIQRRYDLAEKRFSLFNTSRWNDEVRPACCHLVPVLYSGVWTGLEQLEAIKTLTYGGSVAAPGFMNPEGIVIWHEAARQLFKKTILHDEVSKGEADAMMKRGAK
jgi:RNA ligase